MTYCFIHWGILLFSSLISVSALFESSIGSLVTSSAFNGDKYWAQSSNEVIPTQEDLGEAIDQYKGFYNESLGKQFSGFIDKAFKKNQKVRLENFGPN